MSFETITTKLLDSIKKEFTVNDLTVNEGASIKLNGTAGKVYAGTDSLGDCLIGTARFEESSSLFRSMSQDTESGCDSLSPHGGQSRRSPIFSSGRVTSLIRTP